MKMVFDVMNQSISSAIDVINDGTIYLSIIILFLLGILFCVCPVLRNRYQIKKAAKQIAKRHKEVLDTADLFKNSWLKSCWNNYRTNNEAMEKDGSHCDINVYFNENSVISIPERAKLSDILPGIFTSLGILGTFIGLTSGISGIDASSTAGMQTSINTLLSGMSVAFRTSIVGVLFSIMYNLMRRFVNQSALSALKRFVQVCETELYQPIDPGNELLSAINKMLDSQACLSEKIGNELVEALHREVTPAFDNIVEVLGSFTTQIDTRQREGINEMLDTFVTKANANIQTSIEEITTMIGRASQIQENQASIQDQHNEVLMQAVNTLKQQTDSFADTQNICRQSMEDLQTTVERIHALLNVMKDTYEASEKQYSELLEHSSKQEAQINAQMLEIDANLENFAKHAGDLKIVIQDALDQNHEVLDNGQKQLETLVDEMKEIVESMMDSTKTLDASMDGFVSSIQMGLGQSFSSFDEAMSQAVQHLSYVLESMQDAIDEIPQGIRLETEKYLKQMQALNVIVEEYIQRHE